MSSFAFLAACCRDCSLFLVPHVMTRWQI